MFFLFGVFLGENCDLARLVPPLQQLFLASHPVLKHTRTSNVQHASAQKKPAALTGGRFNA